MSNNESIKDTLNVIRRALEEDNDFSQKNENVLILNKKVNEDGTVKFLGEVNDIKEINNVIDKKLDDLLEKKFTNLLEKHMTIILDKYFKNKN